MLPARASSGSLTARAWWYSSELRFIAYDSMTDHQAASVMP